MIENRKWSNTIVSLIYFKYLYILDNIMKSRRFTVKTLMWSVPFLGLVNKIISLKENPFSMILKYSINMIQHFSNEGEIGCFIDCDTQKAWTYLWPASHIWDYWKEQISGVIVIITLLDLRKTHNLEIFQKGRKWNKKEILLIMTSF